MNVLGVRRSGGESPYVDRMYDIGSLMEVLGQSDYVIVTLPLTNETRHLFGQAQFRAMKPSAYFINIGRGGTTDTDALADALRNGNIAGAGLDVFEQEPAVKPRLVKLAKAGKVVLLPHMGSATIEGRMDMGDKVIVNIKTWLDGHRPPDRVLPQAPAA